MSFVGTRLASPREGASVPEVIHDAAVLGIRYPCTAKTVHPSSTAIALECVLARCDDLETDSAESVSRGELHVLYMDHTNTDADTIHFIRF